MIAVIAFGLLLALGATLLLLACVMSNAGIRDQEDRERDMHIRTKDEDDDNANTRRSVS